MIRGSWCSKSRLAREAGAEVLVQQRNEKSHTAVARSAFASQNAQNTTFASQNVQNTSASKQFFESSDVKKLHAAVARSTFSSQNQKKLPGSGYFLKLDVEK